MTLSSPAFRLALLSFLIAISAVSTRAGAQNVSKTGLGSTVTTDQVRAELLAHAPEGVTPGKPVWVGLQMAHKPEWHTYWKNSGDSGLPTVLEWTLPKGVVAGDIAWPLPKKIPIGNLANYGYEGTVLLPVPLTVTPDFKPGVLGGDLEVKLKAAWLVCRKECIPEEGEFLLKVPVKSTTALNGPAFEAAFKAQPQPLLSGTAGILPDSTVQLDGNAIKISVQNLPVALRGKTLDFFPETPEVIETAAQWTQAWNGAVWTASVPLSPQRSNSPVVMPVVLVADGQGVRAELKVLGAWPQGGATVAVSPALEAALKANAPTRPAGPCVGRVAGHAAGGIGRCPAGRADPEPDALRVPGAGHQGGELHPACRQPARPALGAASPTPPAWCCRLWRWAH
jgi:DsbC/DsbD-like thiol-disulfide interchange protein